MSDAETLTTATEPTAPSSTTPPAPEEGPAAGGAGQDSLRGPGRPDDHRLFGYPVVKNLVMSFQGYALRTFISGRLPGWVWTTTWPW